MVILDKQSGNLTKSCLVSTGTWIWRGSYSPNEGSQGRPLLHRAVPYQQRLVVFSIHSDAISWISKHSVCVRGDFKALCPIDLSWFAPDVFKASSVASRVLSSRCPTSIFVVFACLSTGAEVNRATSNNDHTVLSLACAGGHLNVVELLLEHGSNPSHKLKVGRL